MSFRSFIKPKIKNLLKNRTIIKILSFFIYLYAQFVGYSTRWKINGTAGIQQITNGKAIFIGWHARATMMPFFWRKLTQKKLYALVSPHQDGQIIANFLKWYKIDVVSGSTNENAKQSALEIMRLLQENNNIFISPDGPRGPRMRMKKSPVYFAAKTGLPIICVCYSSSHALVIEKAWDKTVILLPFGKGFFTLSDPIYIPKDLTDEQIEEYRLLLENTANKLCFDCDKKSARPPILPASAEETRKKRT